MSSPEPSEAWFLDPEWQNGEHEVDLRIAAGQVVVTDGVEDFLESLDNPHNTS